MWKRLEGLKYFDHARKRRAHYDKQENKVGTVVTVQSSRVGDANLYCVPDPDRSSARPFSKGAALQVGAVGS